VRLSQFTEKADAGIRAAVKDLKGKAGGPLQGLILDLRNDPAGYWIRLSRSPRRSSSR